ncbi:hypothetical protein COLO4_16950 [Corchorus olitorius]|uniref:Uncharacterized protein n=1 Tax=Corchorus olitorius TaxID=93759 RepID=A0A1R3JEW0_9ROSI|nr:hypothetical protein COLO4_16950 [Corchorus olitorius]
MGGSRLVSVGSGENFRKYSHRLTGELPPTDGGAATDHRL